MNYDRWLKFNTSSLDGKTVAITGSTGGLGLAICEYLAKLGANFILLDRDNKRSRLHKQAIQSINEKIDVKCITLDLSDINSVKRATDRLKSLDIDYFLHNAGAYSIERCILNTGLDNVFQINFAAPYYMIKQLLPGLRNRKGKVIVVGSIAHNYSKTDMNDIDFSGRKASSKVYGNSKRYLMFSLYNLFKHEKDVGLSVVHPGITFTNITAHYPKYVFMLIKYPMKVIFMKPKKAALCLLKGFFDTTEENVWIGPKFFNIWGNPSKNRLKTVAAQESEEIFTNAERIYGKILSIVDT